MRRAKDFLMGIDANGIPGAVRAIRSIFAHHGREYRLHVLVDEQGTQDALTEALRKTRGAPVRRLSFTRVTNDPIMNLRMEGTRLPRSSAFRLIGAEVLDGTASRFVYVDYDVECTASLRPLFELDLKGRPVGAVPDGLVDGRFCCAHEQVVSASPLARPARYFNSGVLVVDVAEWQRARVTDKALALMHTWPFPYADQDALNVVLAGKWTEMDPRFNVQTSFALGDADTTRIADATLRAAVESALREPALLHFCGPGKPWEDLPYGHPLDVIPRTVLPPSTASSIVRFF